MRHQFYAVVAVTAVVSFVLGLLAEGRIRHNLADDPKEPKSQETDGNFVDRNLAFLKNAAGRDEKPKKPWYDDRRTSLDRGVEPEKVLDTANVMLMPPGSFPYPVGDGFTLKLDEPVQEGGLGGVYLRGTLTNIRAGKVRKIEFLDYARAHDLEGNVYFSCLEGMGRHAWTLYPNEAVRVGWYYARPVPGVMVTYEFGLADNLVGCFHKAWSAAPAGPPPK